MPKRPTFAARAGEHVFVVFKYITGGETWTIREVYTSALRSPAGSEERRTMDRRGEEKAIEIVVSEMDGSTDNIVSRVMALPKNEYDELMEHLTPVIDPKKKSETPSPNTQPTDLSKTTS